MSNGPSLRRHGRTVLGMGGLALILGLTGCASSSVTQTGGMSSYQGLTDVKTVRTKARISADAAALAKAKSIRLEPVAYGEGAAEGVSESQRALIANRVMRELCVRLSNRFDIVTGKDPADMRVRTVITRLTPTNREAAAANLPLRAAGMVFGVPAPRVPLGMGTFAAEGEAVDAAGAQRAVMVWARGADALTTRARVSKIGDAYELSGAFADDMANLVITGKNPLHELSVEMLKGRQRPVASACDAYGKSHDVESFMSGFVGAPPEWTDGKPPPAPPPPPSP
jgi:hypothetical protein